jgi:hypothetical protein
VGRVVGVNFLELPGDPLDFSGGTLDCSGQLQELGNFLEPLRNTFWLSSIIWMNERFALEGFDI